jgi:hypothetical protein
MECILGLSIINPFRRVNPIQHNTEINGLSMNLIFFYFNQIELGSGQPNSTRLIIFF